MSEVIRIGIDLDDTLNNLMDHWLDRYNLIYDDNLKPSDIPVWEISEYVKPECGMKIFKLLEGIFRNLGIQEGAADVVNQLLEKPNVEVYIVSAYYRTACLDKAEWVKEYLPNFPQTNVIFCHPKHLLKLDYLIDDSPYNHRGFDGEYLIFDTAHNQIKEYPELTGMKRFFRWDQIERYFKWKKIL